MAKTIGIKAADALQFLTGKPQDIGKDNPMFQRVKQMMALEVGNFRERGQKLVDKLKAGNASVYKRNPQLLNDLDELTTATMGTLPVVASAQAPVDHQSEAMAELKKRGLIK
jgi:hypothetical protein